MSYREVKDDLKTLLVEFGPYRTTYSPENPFVRLTIDGIWNLNGLEKLNTKKDWTERELIANHTLGGFTLPVCDGFKKTPTLIKEIASNLLRQNFPDTIHQDVLDEIGLDLDLIDTGLDSATAKKQTRSPDFRNRFLQAYEYCCAILLVIILAGMSGKCSGGQYGVNNYYFESKLSALANIFLTKGWSKYE